MMMTDRILKVEDVLLCGRFRMGLEKLYEENLQEEYLYVSNPANVLNQYVLPPSLSPFDRYRLPIAAPERAPRRFKCSHQSV